MMLYWILSQASILAKEPALAGLITEAVQGLQPREARAAAILERRNFEGVIFDQIISEIRDNPAGIFVILKNESATDIEKTIALRLAQSLPASEYLRVIDRLLQDVNSGVIDPIYLNQSIRVSEQHLRSIWDDKNSSDYREILARKLLDYYEGDEIYEGFFKKVANNEIVRPPLGTGSYSAKERAEVRAQANGRDPALDTNLRDPISRNHLQSGIQETTQPKDPSRLPWIIGGVLLFGILAMLLKVWMGRSAR